MEFARPVVIVSYPRSGSSLVAGIFAAHGVWCGTCRPASVHNPRGYFEHSGMSKLIGQSVGHSVNKGVVPEPPAGWRDRVEAMLVADGYPGGPWLYKSSAVYWRLLEPWDPYWVVCRRPMESVRQSGRKSGAYRPNPKNIRAHEEALAAVIERGAVEVWPSRIVAGDLGALEAAFSIAGLELDPEMVRNFVDPKLWHFA